MEKMRINFSTGIDISHVDAPIGKDGECHLMKFLCALETLRERREPDINYLIGDYENMAKMYVQGLRDCEAIDDEGLKSLFSLIEGDGTVLTGVKL